MTLFEASSPRKHPCNNDNFVLPPNQPSIDAALDCTRQTDIQVPNNVLLDITIADLCHCMNLPDSLVESSQFKKLNALLALCRVITTPLEERR